MIWSCDIQIWLFLQDHMIIIINHTIILPDPGPILYRECRQLSRLQPIQTMATPHVIYTRESDCDSQSECDGDTDSESTRSPLLKTRKLDEAATYHCHFKLEGKKDPSYNYK